MKGRTFRISIPRSSSFFEFANILLFSMLPCYIYFEDKKAIVYNNSLIKREVPVWHWSLEGGWSRNWKEVEQVKRMGFHSFESLKCWTK